MSDKATGYGHFSVYELPHSGNLQIAMPLWAQSELQHEVNENEYEYPSLDGILEPLFDGDWDMTIDSAEFEFSNTYGPYRLYYGSKIWSYTGLKHPTQILADQGYIIFEAVEYGCEEPKTVSPEQEITATNKVTKIVLMNKQITIHREDNWHTYCNCDMTAASRIRLNDVLIVWSETGKVESRPYVGPSWSLNTLHVVSVPTIKKNVNAGKIAEHLDKIQGADNGLAYALLYSRNDEVALREAIGEARSQLIQLMLVLRDIEEESSRENA